VIGRDRPHLRFLESVRICRWQRVARVRRIPWHPVQRASFRPQWRTPVAVRGGTLQVQVGAGPTLMVSASVRR